jgi:N-acetylneuraminate synthase
MARAAEIEDTVRAARAVGGRELLLLKCTSAYPAPPEQANLATMAHLAQLCGCPVGLSDHTLGIGVAVAAAALGACLIEKHFVLDRAAGGPDAAFSLEPAELANLVTEVRRAWQAVGAVHYGPVTSELGTGRRRSLYAVCDIARGEVFTRDNLRSIRPGLGLAPRHLAAVLGRRAARDIPRATPLAWSLLAPEE